MAVFYGALATKGRIYRPHLVRAITSPTGEVIEVISPELLHVVELRESTWDVLHRGMRAVITEGTARSAFQGAGFTAAGKTGTAQVTGREPNAWFGAWAPAEDPEVVVIVMAENAGGGARVAAPVARRVLEAYFARKEGLLKEGRKYD
jgi:penicillin-binding protein 2